MAKHLKYIKKLFSLLLPELDCVSLKSSEQALQLML